MDGGPLAIEGAAMRRKWLWLLMLVVLLVILGERYVHTHPLVFIETHAHCITCAGLELNGYAGEHNGQFPFDPKGYGNALLLLHEDYFNCLTGPGYDAAAFHDAKRTGRDLPDEECGRVYIQGLSKKNNPEIALLFDKLPTPGGDHCFLPARLWAPLGREVCCVGGMHMFIHEKDWPEFTKTQVELLTKEGFKREEAERLFASKPRMAE